MLLRRSLLAALCVWCLCAGRAEAITATLQFPAAASGTTQYGGECHADGSGACAAVAFLTVSTDVTATCKWDTSNVAYASMANYFLNTGQWEWHITKWFPTYNDFGWPNYTYYWACQDNNTLATTSTVSLAFTMDHTYPGTVAANVHAVAISQTKVELQMSDPNAGVFNYKWYRNGSLITTTGSGTYIDTGLTANTVYQYTAAAVDAGGLEPQSPNFLVKTLPSSAVLATPSATVPKLADMESGLIVVNGSETDDWLKYLWNSYHDVSVISTSTDTAKDGTHAFKMHMASTAPTGFEITTGESDGSHNYARKYLVSGAWTLNTYNRMRLWLKVPAGWLPSSGGLHSLELGTYVRSSHGNMFGAGSEESGIGGNHFYHFYALPYTDQWYQLIVDTHPQHERQGPGGTEWQNRVYFSGEPGWSYFDALTRFYIDYQTFGNISGITFPADFYVDDIEFFSEDETLTDIDHISSLGGGYDAASHTIYVGWNHPKDDGTTKADVRYAFSDLYALGFTNGTVFPGTSGGVTPDSDAYSTELINSAAITTAGHSSIFVGIRQQGDTGFRQIEIPLVQSSTPGAGSRSRLRGGGQ